MIRQTQAEVLAVMDYLLDQGGYQAYIQQSDQMPGLTLRDVPKDAFTCLAIRWAAECMGFSYAESRALREAYRRFHYPGANHYWWDAEGVSFIKERRKAMRAFREFAQRSWEHVYSMMVDHAEQS